MERNEERPASKVRKAALYTAGIQAGFAVGIGTVALLSGDFSWLIAISCTVLLGSAVWTLWYLPKPILNALHSAEQKGRKNAIQMLSQYRHDVMNHVQLIKGYLQLEKYDRLQGPIEKLVSDAQRHSVLSNLPGVTLPYTLIERDLTASMLQLSAEVTTGVQNWNPEYELKLLDLLTELADAGENLSQELGIAVEWKIKIHKQADKEAITLHVLGEHVNDTYIEAVIGEFVHKGFHLQERIHDERQYILAFGS
ncbi:Spo0B domain-containing protein [Effusibacillus consociatus]|uniref:Spo0B domain-containing protein n=1 Tax=Effusibacillus consociatus TaxID=1117041 RepID=A0ABV9Q2Q5_9BACL